MTGRVPIDDIAGCRSAHLRLRWVTGVLTDDIARRPSLLPGWTVAHVLAHLAGNATSMCRRVDAALRDEAIEQYPGGAEGRDAEIEAGARRPIAELVAAVVESSGAVDLAFAGVPDAGWSSTVRTAAGGELPLAELPYRRWREVEIHLVDLGVGVAPADWPDALVARMLPRLVEGLPGRADERALTAWLLGRGPAPDLDPWG